MSGSRPQASRRVEERLAAMPEVGACDGGACWSWANLEVRKVHRLTSRLTMRGMSRGRSGRGSTSAEILVSPRKQPVSGLSVAAVPPVRWRQTSTTQKGKKKILEETQMATEEEKRYGDSGGRGGRPSESKGWDAR
ncbi:hypothetical protein NDU88_005557 [Pleurodeles waltl]|uniref:Uncharacterized protein n=1 Tax=Pleurodeles waltl TaxID=8319 RepID=A0AAV7NMW1_PLEWA|nr:hypothetical protein NDU88_005557 [Pleurodeles waltl]